MERPEWFTWAVAQLVMHVYALGLITPSLGSRFVSCQINGMGLEVCATLGMLNEEQAKQLKAAGLTAYNHNLDTSREFYPKVKKKQIIFKK